MRVLVHQIGANDQMLSPWQRRIASTEEKKTLLSLCHIIPPVISETEWLERVVAVESCKGEKTRAEAVDFIRSEAHQRGESERCILRSGLWQ